MTIKPEETKDGIKLRDTATGKLAGAVATEGKHAVPTASAILKGLSGNDSTGAEVDGDFYLNLSKKVKANLPSFGTLPISALSKDQIKRYASSSLLRTIEAAQGLSRTDIASLKYRIEEGKRRIDRIEKDETHKTGGRNDTHWNRNALQNLKDGLRKDEELTSLIGKDQEKYFTALVLLALKHKVRDIEEEESQYLRFNPPAPAEGSPEYPLYAFRSQPLWDKKDIVLKEIETAKDLLTVKVSEDYLDKILELKEPVIDRVAYPQKDGKYNMIQYVPAYEYEQTTSPDVHSTVHIRVPSN